MGKRLIIAGADFTANGIPGSGVIPTLTWYIDRCTASPASGGALNNANLANGGWAYMPTDTALLQNKTINRIKILPSQAGVMNIYKATALDGEKTLVASFTIMSAQVGVITTYELTEFQLGSNEIFVLGEANSAGGFKYLYNPQDMYNGFYSKVPSNNFSPTAPISPGTSKTELNISVGFYG